jgi:hypothetical protein
MSKGTNQLYEVMNPWAEVDPIPLKGIAPRVKDLSAMKIGLFRNSKRAARPTLAVIEARLKARFPGCETKNYTFMPNAGITEQEDWLIKFEEWLKGIDALILAFGD